VRAKGTQAGRRRVYFVRPATRNFVIADYTTRQVKSQISWEEA